MRLSDWIRAIVLAALLGAGVRLSVAAVADPPPHGARVVLERVTGQDVGQILDAAFRASFEAALDNPGNATNAATLRSRT